MNLRPIIFIFFYSLLLLFYPGDNPLVLKLADSLKTVNVKGEARKIKEIPYILNRYFPEVSAKAVFIVEPKEFIPVYMHNPHKRLYPASTTKIVTALVTLDLYKPSDVVTVKREVSEGRVMGLVKGEKITVENLLFGMLVHSANDAAFALADAYGYDAFVEKMNEKARSLGMKNSSFTNPAGFDDPQHYSTAFDLSIATREFLKNPYLRKIVGIKEIVVSDVDFSIFHKLVNVNKLLGEIPGVAGVKTGYTPLAGENLISLYKHNGREILIVILGSTDRFSDTQTIIYWLKSNLRFYRVD